MTKKELVNRLADIDDDTVIVVSDENGGWDNILRIDIVHGSPAIVFGGGSPFTDE